MDTGKIGRYEIKSELGQGGMATVYCAFDPSTERDVAIKVLPRTFLHDPQFRTRFDREAKMIASLEHPAIVPVYDFSGEAEQPYIVMRFMSGGSLQDRLDEGALSAGETSKIVSRLAQALDAAHARSIVHRDLKPGNILFDRYGNAFLSDFGIARLAEGSGSTLTGSAILGTPAYMSPEQVQGDKEIDGRSDVYALGVLVYQMLTGEAPYQADTPAKVIMMHVLDPVPNILDEGADLPQGCESLITRAMAKDPNERYPTAGELAASLASLTNGNGTQETSPVPGEIEAGGQTATAGLAATAVPQPATVASPSKPETTAVSDSGRPPRSRRSVFAIMLILMIICLAAGAIGSAVYFSRGDTNPLAFLQPTPTELPPQPTATQAAPTQTSPPPTPTATVIPTEDDISISETASAEATEAADATYSAILILAQQPTATSTQVEPSPTSVPSQTPTPTLPVIGGADKMAFVIENDIWIVNMDGSQLTKMTEDKTEKTSLQWSLDGQAVNYISGSCVYSVDIESGRNEILVCLNFVDYLKSFQISPDGKQIAMSLDNQLYIIPYDLQGLSEVKVRSDLVDLADCKAFAPYEPVFIKGSHWSADSKTLANIIFGVADDIGGADIIQVLPVDKCIPKPKALDNFPPPRFRMPEYETNPTIQNFGWDGYNLFALTSMVRNDGFGDLYIYNTDLYKARAAINPLDGACCYRDPIWSPDGIYIMFAFQDQKSEDQITRLYMIPYGSIDTGATYEAIPLPDITERRAKPQPALRPAK